MPNAYCVVQVCACARVCVRVFVEQGIGTAEREVLLAVLQFLIMFLLPLLLFLCCVLFLCLSVVTQQVTF